MGDVQSLVSLWVGLPLALVVIGVRLVLRKFREQKFTRGDFWCMAAAFFIFTRLIGNHLLLSYGSTRTLSASERLELLDGDHDVEKRRIVLGSKLILATRSLLICSLWSAKMAVLDLLSRLIMKMPYERRLVYAIWATLFLTFAASITTVFTGCTPLRLAWQLNPDPGDCPIGTIWIYTYEVCNIITDVLLMAVPFSLILSAKIATTQRLRILALFSIGLFLISISIVRIIRGRDSRSQAGHTLWASLEVFCASLVAVTPTIYALVRNRQDTAYQHSHDSHRTAGSRRYTGSVVADDKYSARIWTELEEQDNSSATGILVKTSFQTSGALVR